ncbi:Tetratricopeptide repeat protein 25 [Clonorchis sinensis]|uniref:Outer dynein arm-docking complex subunit 4 n=1 Tax=Clonorchis sinensis TaxID=79923 RepID=A0A419PZH2_CLOSI|nr:Tetratricopeptide repeat protein 25 [Clonorchis sinensis]
MLRDNSKERSVTSKCPFEVYRSEGDAFFFRKKYLQAISCYSQALEKKDHDVHCLLRRSFCYMSRGDFDKAFEDAELALKLEPKFHKALFQKAEVLYNRGDFEFALLHYHQGYKKRPELQEFRLGVQKCEEAIQNALGQKTFPHKKGSDVTSSSEESMGKDTSRSSERSNKKADSHSNQDVPLHLLPKDKARRAFGFLQDDHEYLKKFLKQEKSKKWKTKRSDELSKIANDGLEYLDMRSKFWQQEQPLYARSKARSTKSRTTKTQKAKDQSKNICKVLERLHEIDQYQQAEEHVTAIRLAEGLRREVGEWTEDEFPNRLEVLANVNSMLGISHLELTHYEAALEAHERAYELGEKCNLPEIVSHAADNIGRVHAKKGDYQAAINVWSRKLADCSDKFEQIWLRYEIGRCNLELQQLAEALEHGDHALELAKEVGDESWQLNLNVLIGQANLHMQKNAEAQAAFTRAYDLAKTLKASDAEKAILEVMEEFQSTECELDLDTLNETENSSESPIRKFTVHIQRNRYAPPAAP